MKHAFAIVVLVLACSLAADDEPTGFRGQKFGEPPVGLTQILPAGADGVSVFVRKDEKLDIGPAKLKTVSYLAYKGNLFGVLIEFEGSTNYEHIKTTLTAAYGNPVSDKRETFEKFALWKMQNGVIVYISVNTLSESGKVTYGFQPIQDQREHDEKERAKKASGDL